jgi:hypothetical protein
VAAGLLGLSERTVRDWMARDPLEPGVAVMTLAFFGLRAVH